MFRPIPIRIRLTLWYVALLAVILAAFGTGVYLTLSRSLNNSLDNSIRVQAEAIMDTVRYEKGRPTLSTSPSTSLGGEERFTRVFDSAMEPTFDNTGHHGTVPIDRLSLASSLKGQTTMRNVVTGGEEERLRVVTAPIVFEGTLVGVLEVGQSRDDVTDPLGTLLAIMGVAYPVTLALAVLGGIFLSRRALAPVDRVTDLARRISADDLSQRLDLDLPEDEIGRLARTFDEMIARLDEAFRRQRQFTADASHELRTPLTIMKGQLDVALQKERGPEEYRKVLQAVNDEVDRLVNLAGSLLTLTRADARQVPLTLEDVRVADVVAGAVEHLTPTAAGKQIELSAESGNGVAVNADEDLLIQLLLNLLDNAIKYTPEGGAVSVRWDRSAEDVEIRVRDTGNGISQEHIPLIFDRFYRADEARSRVDGGAGRGLAISKWIAEAHGGSLGVESTLGSGSTFTIRLPIGRS